MSPQRARPCQGPLPPHALPVPATALFGQFELGLGADLLSGVRRQSPARTFANHHGKTVVPHIRHVTVLVATAHAGAGTLEHDPEKWLPVFRKDHAQTKR